jgi:anti-repressor protein
MNEVGKKESAANIQIFENQEFGKVRTILIDGEPWFVGKDVAEILGYSNPSEALMDHVDDDDKLNSKMLLSSKLNSETILSLNLGQRGGWLITESGLYSLILSSKLESAKKFKKWVTSEVLPSLRKTGAYSMEQLSKDFYIQTYADALILAGNLQKRVQEQHERIKEQKKVIEVQKPKVEFYDTVTKSESTFDMAEVAKLLKISNMGSVKLFEFLREQDVLSDNKSNWNEPYQNYVNSGYFKIVETKNEDKRGNVHVNKKTVVFQKGVDFIRKLAKDNGLIKTVNIALF